MAIYFMAAALISVLAFLCISDFVFALIMEPTLKRRTSASRLEKVPSTSHATSENAQPEEALQHSLVGDDATLVFSGR